MKKEINVFEYTEQILNGLKNGVLITTKSGETVNSMAISWGSLGIEWRKPIFVTYVRENRFTRKQLDETMEFTVNIPYGEFNKDILKICGTKSGYNTNKIKELGLTLVDSTIINTPAIKELPLTLECKVVYKQLQDKNEITKENYSFYPEDVSSDFHGANKDYHIAYYGEIVKAYILE